VVETDFGYHIIQLAAVRGGEKKSFESAKADIENEVKLQLAQRRFAELAETFSNTVYEQSDSLQPAADKLKLAVKKATDVKRTPAQGADDALGSPKFLAALFAEDTLKNKRNTEAVEVGPSKLAAGRVVEYSPARKLPLEAVKDRVREALVVRKAAELARKDAEAKLAAWKGGAEPQGLESPIVISRAQAQTLPQPLIDAVMKAPTEPLPAWVRVDFGEEGVALVRIDKLLPRDAASGDIKQLQRQYGQIWGTAEGEAYYAALRQRYKVQVTGHADAGPTDGEAASAPAR
jgi:peptidyl-prolyl cis-trans isomerase D